MTGRDPIAWTPRPGGRSRPARDRPRAPQVASRRVGRCIAARTPRGSPTRPASRGGRERSSSANRDVGTRARAGGGDETRADGTHRAGDGGDVARPEGRARASAHVPLPRVATWTPVEATASGDLREASGRRRVCTSSRRCPSKTRLALAAHRRALARGECVSTGVAHLPSSSVASRRCPVRQLPRGVVEPRKTGATHRLAIALDQSPALRLRDERARRLGDRLARPVGGDHARNPIRLRLSTQLRVVLELRVGRFGRARGFRFGQFGLL